MANRSKEVLPLRACEKCKVTVTGAPERCPLCQGDLTGNPEAERALFPVIPPPVHPHRTLIRFIALGTVALAAACVSINLSFPFGGWWSFFVVAGAASFWLNFAIVIRKLGNIPKTILWQVSLVSALALAWDWATGFRGWSIDYVLPIICSCAMVSMAVIARIMRLRIEDYIIYLVLDGILGVVPLTLILLGVLRVVLPSAVCVAVSIVSLAALLLFEGPALRHEIFRRLHL